MSILLDENNKCISPYLNRPENEWASITKEILKEYPASADEIIDAVLKSWKGILNTKIAEKLKIGEDVFPSPQAIGVLLHELIPVMLAEKKPKKWRRGNTAEKDLVYIPNDKIYSTEIKTSSSKNNIYGNASYGQEDAANTNSKSKDGFYIGVNFEKIEEGHTNPKILKIRIGWLDHTDWHSQRAASGQAGNIPAFARNNKLLLIYDSSSGGKVCDF